MFRHHILQNFCLVNSHAIQCFHVGIDISCKVYIMVSKYHFRQANMSDSRSCFYNSSLSTSRVMLDNLAELIKHREVNILQREINQFHEGGSTVS